MARSKPPKPSQIYVEVDEEEVQEPRLLGPLRGLDPEKDIVKTAVPTIADSEHGPDLDVLVNPVKRATRASRGKLC